MMLRTRYPARDLEVLRVAKELIQDESNWLKGEFTNSKGCYCALGALRAAEDMTTFWNEGAIDRLQKYVAYNTTYSSVAVFNDAPDTTHTDVIEMFTKVIDQTRQEVNKDQYGY